MAGLEWSSVKMTDIQKNILSAGQEGVSAADALKARSEAYQAGKSHGAARFFKGLFSLGINEIWRYANYRGYESDKAKIVDCVKDVYKALAPKLGSSQVKIVFHEAEGFNGNDAEIFSKPHVANKSENVKLMEEKVTIERNPSGTATITFKGNHQETIQDCEQARRHLEMEFMRDAKHFGKDFVTGILNDYKEKSFASLGSIDGNEHGMLHFGVDDDKTKIGARRGIQYLPLMTAKTDEAREAVEARMQDQTTKSAARTHLRDMLSAFYSSQLDLPEEVGRTMDLELGVSLAGKVFDGEIEDGKKLQAFLDKGSKGCHLTSAEGQKVMAQFEKAVSTGDQMVKNVKIGEGVLAPKKIRNTLPQGEVKKLHDFVADLVMNEENTEYDKSTVAGKATGRRLRALVGANKGLVASLMEKKGAELDEALKTLEPRMAKALKESVLEPLENKYQNYVDKQKAHKGFVADRKRWLDASVLDTQKGAAKLRVAIGARSEDEINDYAIESLTQDPKVREGLEEAGLDIHDNPFLSGEEGRQQLALGLDFFGEMEKKVDSAVDDALNDVQKTMDTRIKSIFGQDSTGAVNKSAEELGGMSLKDMLKAYSKDPDITLIKNTLKNYFKDIGILQKRQMLAAQTRFCAEVPGETTDGARFGALLKGAGPVMQKMLQGIDEGKIADKDFKLALEDMKDNLAPISDKAIKAYLFDLVKNSTEPKIESIEVKGSLGQASVGQALLCSVKCAGLEPRECVVKILRPNATLAAHREYDIFMAACGEDASMKATFQGRFDSIKDELDLTLEAENMKIAEKCYLYNKNVAEIGTFTNTTSAKLLAGVKPTSSVIVQEKAEGTNLKKYIDNTSARLTDPNANIPREELEAMKQKLEKTHSALVSTSYMWANEGLFGSGFYHGDLHAGNLMVDDNGKITMIDFGNATQLDKAGKTNVMRVITGAAIGDVDIFLKGYVDMLGETGKANYEAAKDAIKAKLEKVFANKGLADTALRMNIALNILQLDFKIEVPGAVHNFLESQKRLSAAMDDTATLLDSVNKKLGVENAPKPLSMMQCLVQVVKNNVMSANLLKAVGIRNAPGVLRTIQNDPLLNKQPGNVQNNNGNNGAGQGEVVIYP